MIEDMQIKGLHATYWKELCDVPGNVSTKTSDSKQHYKIFERYIDAYLLAPILGCMFNRKGNFKYSTESDDTAGMLQNVQSNNYQLIWFIYEVVMLSNPDKAVSTEERIKRAFKDRNNSEAMKHNTGVYLDYFKGGLEILYEVFVEKSITDEDYINRIREYIVEYKSMFNIGDMDIEAILANK